MKPSNLNRTASALLALSLPLAVAQACEPAALVEALAQAPASPPKASPSQALAALRLQPAELDAWPALARTESLLRRVGLPLAWHRIDASLIEAARDAGGGAVIVARSRAQAGQWDCEAVTRPGSDGIPAVQSPSSTGADRSVAPASVLALLPVRDDASAKAVPSVQEAVRGMLADFRLAMRVGAPYAPAGAWVASPWLSQSTVYRSQDLPALFPGGPTGRAQTRVQISFSGIGLTRGLSRDTSTTLLAAGQNSRLQTRVSYPAFGPAPAVALDSTGRQHDTLVGLGLYSVLVRQEGVRPTVVLNARGFAPSNHSRANGSIELSSLYDIGRGWGLVAAVGADAERPKEAASRQGRSATLGANVQLSARWTATVDVGRREVRELSDSQSVQRLRLYHSLASLSYVALVLDRQGDDRRTLLTLALPI